MDYKKYPILSTDEIKNRALSILKNFRDICERNYISYYLAYGTLIGAVRHQGFIPWDDDIDVWVPINQYNTLMRVLKDESPFKIINCLTDPVWIRGFSKLSDMETLIVDNFENPYGLANRGISIDIFPLFGADDEKERRSINHTALMMSRMNNFSAGMFKGNIVKNSVFASLDLVGKNRLYYRSRLFEKEFKAKEDSFLGNVTTIYGMKDFHKTELFQKCQLLFEGEKFCAPAGYDSILRQLYGDYMVLPPLEKRVQTHDTITYLICDV